MGNDHFDHAKMPRSSLRKRILNRLQEITFQTVRCGLQLQLCGLSTQRVDEILFQCRQLEHKIKSQRYLKRGRYRKKTNRFAQYLDSDSDDCLLESEFKVHFRMSRSSFWELVSLVKDHPAFHRRSSDSRGPPPKPPESSCWFC